MLSSDALHAAAVCEYACNRSPADVVSMLLDAGVPANSKDGYGRSALRISCLHPGSVRTTRLILQAGAKVNEDRDIQGRTALCISSRYNRLELISLLLEHGANINAKRDHGRSALWEACYYRCSNVVDVLLEAGATVDYYDLRWNCTPLFVAGALKWKYGVETPTRAGAETGGTSYKGGSSMLDGYSVPEILDYISSVAREVGGQLPGKFEDRPATLQLNRTKLDTPKPLVPTQTLACSSEVYLWICRNG